MQIDLGTPVRTLDDREIGQVDRLILDPDTGQVKAVVIHRGVILTDDVEVSIEAFELDAEGSLRIGYLADQVKDLSRFDPDRYATPHPDSLSAWGYPEAAEMLWPAYYLAGPALPDRRAAAGPGTTEFDQPAWAEGVIREGSAVVSEDGHPVGEIAGLTFEAPSGQLSRFAVRSGFLVTKEIELPGDAIASADDQTVYLRLTRDQIQALAGG